MTPVPTPLQLDVAILGGGVAGLWLLERLRRQGYQAALFSRGPLGEGQTIAAQGMIHGGGKYRLRGNSDATADALAQMPGRWRDCLQGSGEVDLGQTRVLSDDFYLWAPTLAGKFSGFLASLTLRDRLQRLPAASWPDFLHIAGSGRLYRMHEQVIDVPSLLHNLASNNAGAIFQLPEHALLQRGANGLHLKLGDTLVTARRWVMTAGSGNAEILRTLGYHTPAMQTRPLQQVLVRHSSLPVFFGHCLGGGSTPRLSISTHHPASGDRVWYLGGALAERGAALSQSALIADAQMELTDLFPGLDLTGADYATLTVDRAEPRQTGMARPAGPFAEPVAGSEDILVAWPTKLTLAPALAQRVMDLLPPPAVTSDAATPLAAFLTTPAVAAPPWETQL